MDITGASGNLGKDIPKTIITSHLYIYEASHLALWECLEDKKDTVSRELFSFKYNFLVHKRHARVFSNYFWQQHSFFFQRSSLL